MLRSTATFTALVAAVGCLPLAQSAAPGTSPSAPRESGPEAAPLVTGEASVPSDVPVATIHGVKTSYRRSRLAGSAKRGYRLSLFELDDPGKIRGEVNASIEGPLVTGKSLPVMMTFLQIGDSGPRSSEGVRAVGCHGEGTLVLDRVPKIPKAVSEEQELGNAHGNLAIAVECPFDAAELGSFTISGPITAKVTSVN